jgi:hypothetical protein
MLWWLKSAPVSVPLLSTYVPGSLSATTGSGGAFGVPGTIVLTPDHLGYGPSLGGRVTLGGWIDDEHRFGLEGSGFLLASQTAGSTFLSDGTSPLRALFVNPPPGSGFPLGQSSFVLADPGYASGGQLLTSSIRLWGAEANGLYQAINEDNLSLSLLGGFRYLDLAESLTITDSESFASFGNYTATDAFGTHNQFYGGQLGFKADGRWKQFFASVQAKVALGVDHESVTINGITGITPLGGPTTIAGGGLYAQGTNIGRTTHDEFAVVPSVQVQTGVDITRHLRAFVSYDFLYLSNVARPGDQIDQVLNLTQNHLLSASAPGLVGVPHPAQQLSTTDFWAHGVSIGLRISY